MIKNNTYFIEKCTFVLHSLDKRKHRNDTGTGNNHSGIYGMMGYQPGVSGIQQNSSNWLCTIGPVQPGIWLLPVHTGNNKIPDMNPKF